jgi:hypothetical protein
MNNNGVLTAPERNHYFYGKLMDVVQFEKEQHYFNQKRWLLNRLGLGSGVGCGLDVIVDPEVEGMLRIQPGVAIDGLGREIIVSEAVVVKPGQLTDEQGAPVGDLDEGTVSICLAYAETQTDPVPVLVPDCDTPGNCACSTIRESFWVLVRPIEDGLPEPPTCGLKEFPLPADGDLHTLLCQQINAPCPEAPADLCVPLARVTLPLNDESIDACAGRRLVYGNALLYELILCLAEHIAGTTHGPNLRYVSGDGQTGSSGERLAERLVVELLDAAGNPVKGGLVQFEVTAGDGSVSRKTIKTNSQGRAGTRWKLGAGPEGIQQVTARTVGTALTVTFRARAITRTS